MSPHFNFGFSERRCHNKHGNGCARYGLKEVKGKGKGEREVTLIECHWWRRWRRRGEGEGEKGEGEKEKAVANARLDVIGKYLRSTDPIDKFLTFYATPNPAISVKTTLASDGTQQVAIKVTAPTLTPTREFLEDIIVCESRDFFFLPYLGIHVPQPPQALQRDPTPSLRDLNGNGASHGKFFFAFSCWIDYERHFWCGLIHSLSSSRVQFRYEGWRGWSEGAKVKKEVKG